MADEKLSRDPVLYVCTRPMKSMNPGKAQAHSGHAACAFLFKAMTEFKATAKSKNALGRWISATPQGFGTQINLKAPSEEIWIDFNNEMTAIEIAEEDRNIFGTVIDPTYPYIVSSEMKNLLDHGIHTLPPKFNPKKNEWVCFREEITAFYLFDNGSDNEVSDLLKKRGFILHP